MSSSGGNPFQQQQQSADGKKGKDGKGGDKTTTTTTKKLPAHLQRIFIHPTSVNFKTNQFRLPYLYYMTTHHTTKPYVMDCTEVNPYLTSDYSYHFRPHGLKIPILMIILKQHFKTLINYVVEQPQHIDLFFSSPFIAAMSLLMASGGY